MFVSPFVPQRSAYTSRRRSDVRLFASPIADLQTDEVVVICSDPTTGEERTATGHLAAVDGRVYLRPRGGRRCSWARALADGESIAIATATGPVPVRPVPVRKDSTQQRVSEALLGRFGYAAAMPALLEDASLAATVELVAEPASAVPAALAA
jgi:hypothetical protein